MRVRLRSKAERRQWKVNSVMVQDMTTTKTNVKLGDVQQSVSLSQQLLKQFLLVTPILSGRFFRLLAGFNYYDTGVKSRHVLFCLPTGAPP